MNCCQPDSSENSGLQKEAVRFSWKKAAAVLFILVLLLGSLVGMFLA